MFLLVLAFLSLLFAIFLLVQASRRQKASGLPTGRVIYTDTGAWGKIEKPLYDSFLGLTGKPDYMVEQGEFWIPVEVKSTWAPDVVYENHIFQVAAYCALIDKAHRKRPPYGILRYRNRSIALDYTQQMEASLLDLLAEMRQQERQGVIDRSHSEPARCARCGYRSICDQKL